MKLYDVPEGSRIKLANIGKTPPDCESHSTGEEFMFHHLDGMYSLCTNDDGERIYLEGWTEVEIINKP